jgi:hypothetical protein
VSACETGGTLPISALTNAFSIDVNYRREADDFEARIIESAVTDQLTCDAEATGCVAYASVRRRSADDSQTTSRRFAGESHRDRRAHSDLDLSYRHSGAIVQLQPKRPPGRADRKAAAYAAEIVRLRGEGYTYEAIREALAQVGIELSECALRREVRRHAKRTVGATSDVRPTLRSPVARSLPVARPLAGGPPSSTNATGREIAEAFFNANPSNPLLQTKESS